MEKIHMEKIKKILLWTIAVIAIVIAVFYFILFLTA